jgi:hypothetical protein
MPSGMRPVADILYWYYSIDLQLQSLVCSRPFLCVSPSSALRGSGVNRSTGSKQTLNGLFICSPLVYYTRSKFTQFLPFRSSLQNLTLIIISQRHRAKSSAILSRREPKVYRWTKKELKPFLHLVKGYSAGLAQPHLPIGRLSRERHLDSSGLDLNIHTRRQIQLGQCIHSPRRRRIDIQ